MKSNSNAGIEHDFIDQFGRIHIDCKPLPTPPLPPRPVHSSRTSVDRIHKPRQSEPAILRPQISFPGPTFRGSPIRRAYFYFLMIRLIMVISQISNSLLSASSELTHGIQKGLSMLLPLLLLMLTPHRLHLPRTDLRRVHQTHHTRNSGGWLYSFRTL